MSAPDTQAQSFMAQQAQRLLDDPAFAAKAAANPESCAREAAAAAIGLARDALPQSSAALSFDALVVSSQDAMLDSIERSFGSKAAAALREDPSAMALLPKRSQCALAAWRFPDGSFALSCKAVDGSFEAMGLALESSQAFRAALGPGAEDAIERAKAAGWGAQAACAIDHASLLRMILSLSASESLWLPGVNVSERSTGRGATPASLAQALDEAPLESSLDQALASVFAEKNAAPAPAAPPEPAKKVVLPQPWRVPPL